ncbi:hypothetical protein JCM33374_g2651 [Metschnikowia sp. JCM 33374]|nr:hypothetical protein JCM33374_g2651 [Metschnikowia sp. JCM 33374]
MASDEEQPATVESSPEPVPSSSTAPKKAKRLTLQERLAAAAKARRKKADENTPTEPKKGAETPTPRQESETEAPETGSGSLVEQNPQADASLPASIPPPSPIDQKPLSEVPETSKATETTSPETLKADIDTQEKSRESPVPNDQENSDYLSKQDSAVVNGDSATNNGDSVVLDVTEKGNATAINEEVAKADSKEKGTEDVAKDDQIALLKKEVEALKLKLEEQKKESASSMRRIPQPKDTDKRLAEKDRLLAQSEKKLADRDTTIQQLMDEGQELSKKELKLNERIRSLVATNTKLESSLRSYAEKNEESLLKLGEIEDVIKTHKLKSIDQLMDAMAASNQKNTELQTALDKLKDSNWEGKYRELQRVYERELDEKKECKRQLSETTVQLELLQNQSRLELQSKADIIAQLNREIMSSKDESSTEVLRLESKIESLRMENENFLKTSQGSSADNTTQGGDSVAPKKSVDYVDFVKLSDTHQNLQAQYVSSQESWKLIESNLLNKVEALTASVENMKKAKAKSAAELKKLHSKLNSQVDEIESLKTKLATAIEEVKEQDFRIQMKKTECSELEEKLEDLKTVFASDRKNYDLKIKNLSETVKNLENQTPTFTPSMSFDNLTSIQGRRGMRDGGLHINMDHRNSVQRKFSTHSLASSALNTPAHGWEDQSFVNDTHDSGIYDTHNVSSLSFNEDIYPFEAPEPGETPLSANFGSSGSGATKNIQLINKMSASIRRLEGEISTLKEENEQLAAERVCSTRNHPQNRTR